MVHKNKGVNPAFSQKTSVKIVYLLILSIIVIMLILMSFSKVRPLMIGKVSSMWL